MSYQTTLSADRRLSLLLVLAQTPGYSANAFLLRDAVADIFGHRMTADQVLTEIAWLTEQELLTSRKAGDVTLATLTPRGADAAAGLASVPGVKKPIPTSPV